MRYTLAVYLRFYWQAGRGSVIVSDYLFILPTGTLKTQAVETVEKVPSQKFLPAKWEKSRKINPVLGLRRSIWAVFQPQVGDFSAEFAKKGFFDSLVG